MKDGGVGGADRRIGMVIGDYVITEKIAEGGMGAVYVATNQPTGLKQIVKFMLAEYVANPALRERFEREIQAAVRLKGKTNIVEIYSCNKRDGELYMTMEYLRGETLQRHLLRCGRISTHHAFRLIAQVIAALYELHEAGIIHRDLKPTNIFVVPTDSEAYCVKLIDFGIIHDAAARTQKTQRGVAVGTPGYMALEQFGDAGNVTPAADVFALAVIIWEMFTGQLPWSAPTDFALYERQKSEPPRLRPGDHLPCGWEPIVRAALSPNPAERPRLHTLLYALAREVPADPPIPCGFDMVLRYAPRVLRNTPPEVETVRASDPNRAAVAYWAMLRTTVASHTRPSAADRSSSSAPERKATAALPPTVNGRPATRTSIITRRFASSRRALARHKAALPKPAFLTLLGIGCALVAGGLSFGVSQLRMGTNACKATTEATVDERAQHARETIVDAGTARAPEPQREALATPLDAALSAAPHVDTPVDSQPSKAVARRPKTTNMTTATTPMTQAPRSSSDGSGSGRWHKFDPNAPAGEDE